MKRLNSFIILFVTLAGVAMMIGSCKKDKKYDLITPPPYVHFNGAKSQSYIMNVNPPAKYQVTVGTTDVASVDRTVTYKITSPTNAVAGTHYTITPAGTTLTIPAGQTTAAIEIQGIFAQYTGGRKDTLVFTLSTPSMDPAKFSDTVRLAIKGPCFDGDLVTTPASTLIGSYANSMDDGFGPWGPYTTSVVSVTPLTATTARAVLNNVWDDGFGNVNFIMDWTDPMNTVIRIEAPTITPADAGILNPAYAGMQLVIRDHPTPGTASNKFSVCTNMLWLRYQLGVYNPATSTILGYFPNVGTTIMSH